LLTAKGAKDAKKISDCFLRFALNRATRVRTGSIVFECYTSGPKENNMANKSLTAMAVASLVFMGTTAAPSALPNNPPAGPAITGVELHPASTLLVQPCPVELVFHGDITTTRPVTVTYTWVDSRGRAWPEHRRRISLSGVSAVTHKWKVGRPGKTVDVWVQLKIISPESQLSGKVPVHFTCAK
jgi:hypothetical protein